ncbi:winged helix-turn-helix transcriptional regulator [Skermania sp. ID1734]|uniref:ArsR/SmtB family transcription factor n=1 Tax=Skermania sp. ID1734 TaxID=2597516 RepID=UPI00117F4D57|nr:winged helix-turn-helix domain-containing protein [Skermania sp. ID1734]TSD96612.1 winged helix-turn-helix transcriptional regulator [Skermania sp. ID1734]
MADEEQVRGVADVAAAAALLADETRARIVFALTDGRSLPASVLAAEAGVAASTTSEHLSRLVTGGMVTVQQSGRHRYYRLANEHVAAAVEALAVVAPAQRVRSLRDSTRAAALRRARTCYDHLAGRLGVAVTESLIDCGALERHDGVRDARRADGDPFAAQLSLHPYRIGPRGAAVFGELGVELSNVNSRTRPLLRFCVDWSEQRHHLAGALGAALLTSMESAGWIRRNTRSRAVTLTDNGELKLREILPLESLALRRGGWAGSI